MRRAIPASIALWLSAGIAHADDDEATWQRACAAGRFDDCDQLAEWLHMDGQLARSRRAQKTAFRLAKRQCSDGAADACVYVATAYAGGEGSGRMHQVSGQWPVKPSRRTSRRFSRRAMQLYKNACDAGNVAACYSVTGVFDAEWPDAWGDPDGFVSRACNGGIGRACTQLAQKQPDAERDRLLRRACFELAEAQACFQLGRAGDRQAQVRACHLDKFDDCKN